MACLSIDDSWGTPTTSLTHHRVVRQATLDCRLHVASKRHAFVWTPTSSLDACWAVCTCNESSARPGTDGRGKVSDVLRYSSFGVKYLKVAVTTLIMSF